MNVAEHCHANVHIELFFDVLAHFYAASCAFSHDYDAAVLAAVQSFLEPFAHFVAVAFNFRDQDNFGARSESDLESNETVVAAHDLDDEYPFVRSCGVAYLVDGVQCGVYSGIETDGGVGTRDVVVY